MINFDAARQHMILGQVRTNDIQDLGVIDAMASLPRENFVPMDRQHLAYADLCVPLKPGRHLLDPRSLAKLLQLARIAPNERILDVAGGTGYSAAVLCQLSASVVALEEDEALAKMSATALGGIPNKEKLTLATGAHIVGWPKEGPYDVILVNGAIPGEPPSAWATQLKIGGRLVVIVNRGPLGKARLFVNEGGKLAGRDAFDANVPLLPGFEQTPSFAF